MPPKNPYLNQATKKKNTYQNVPTQKNPEIENFNPPANPSIIPVSWHPEYQPPPPRPWELKLKKVLKSISYCERKQ